MPEQGKKGVILLRKVLFPERFLMLFIPPINAEEAALFPDDYQSVTRSGEKRTLKIYNGTDLWFGEENLDADENFSAFSLKVAEKLEDRILVPEIVALRSIKNLRDIL